jgi:hypothetical protein
MGRREMSSLNLALKWGPASFGLTLVFVIALSVAPSLARANLQAKPRRTFVTNGTVSSVVPTSSATYIAGTFTRVAPRTGPGVGIDATTARSTGLPEIAGATQQVYAVARDGSGGFYVGGNFTRIGSMPRRSLAHILANGRVDPAFQPNVHGSVRALAVSGHRLYVGGNFDSLGGKPRSNVGAVDTASGKVTSWEPDADRLVTALAASKRTVYVGGSFTTIGGQQRTDLAAIDVATGAATAWDPHPNGAVKALALSGGTVYVAGQITSIGGKRRNGIAAVDPTTGTATSWNPNASDPVNALAVSGQTVYAGGRFERIGNQPRASIAAIDATSGQATAWDPGAREGGALGRVQAIVVSGGTVYAGGRFTEIGGQSRDNLAAISATTGGARAWSPEAAGQVNALAVSGDMVYAGGAITSIGGRRRNGLAALNPTTGKVMRWNPEVERSQYAPVIYALTVTDDTVYIGGVFDSIRGKPRPDLGAVDAATGKPTSWNPKPKYSGNPNPAPVEALDASGQTVYVGGDFESIGGHSRNGLAGVDAVTGKATSFNPRPEFRGQPGYIDLLAVSAKTVYAAGAFDQIGDRQRHGLAALNATTSKATAFNPGQPAESVAPLGSTVYAGGAFSMIGRQPRNGIAALDASTGAASPWDPNITFRGRAGEVFALAVSGHTVYVGGQFDSVGGQPRSNLAAIDDDTGQLLNWDPHPVSFRVNTLAFGPDGSLWAGGSFPGFSSAPQAYIAKFSP